MLKKVSPSVGQMAEILDNAPVAVIVSKIESRELLYANRLAEETLLQDLDTGEMTCYRVAGFQEPCPFCHADNMSRTELLHREFHHPVSGRHYRLSGKIVDWDGEPAHIEYIQDITEAQKEEEKSNALREELLATFSSIPCGLCVYQFDGESITPVFHNPAFYRIMGYSKEHIEAVEKQTNYLGVHPEDLAALQEKIQEAIHGNGVIRRTYRIWNDQKQEYRWIRLEGSVKCQKDGTKLLYGVYSDVSSSLKMEKELKEAQLEMDHLVNSIPGGIASYRIEGKRFIPTYFSDGATALSGHNRQEFEELVRRDAFEVIYEADRPRVLTAVEAALESGEVLDISYRMRHKDGNLIWIHLNGRRMDPIAENTRFYAVFTGMSAESRLFQSIANETADGIYVIDKKSYDLLYVNESKVLFRNAKASAGQKCFEAMYGRTSPCVHCSLKERTPDGQEYELAVDGTDRIYSTHFRETDWNGIPAYVKYIQDITEEVKVQREKERLEEYFQTVVKNLPGGVAVVRYEKDGSMTPEFLSDGFAAMTGMTVDEAWELYRNDAMTGVHPEDQERVIGKMAAFVDSGESHCEIIYRLKKGNDGYIWVKNTLSIIQSEGGTGRVYAGYHDITKEREEQEHLREQYNDLIIQHYRTPGPNALIVGHCNITRNKILEILDYTDSDLMKHFGSEREEFFLGIASLIVEQKDRRAFEDKYLNGPSLAAFERGDRELILNCYIKIPKEEHGRYVQFKVNLVETPDTGDVTGILTVTDITEQTVSDRIMRQLSVTSYDLVVDVDLFRDSYTVLTCNEESGDVPEGQGSHSERIDYMLREQVLPKDREHTARLLDQTYMLNRLEKDGSYSFSYSISGEKGDILTKTLTVSAIDLRLGRICLARTDITDSVREQQGLLNVIAYTFELLGLINIDAGRLTLYTRRTVLENLSPIIVDGYDSAVGRLAEFYDPDVLEKGEIERQFRMETMLEELEKRPAGYDFVLPYHSGGALRYKQINVLWGDGDHKTVCMVRADVTDILSAERQTKNALEKALTLAEEANRAKSEFLSSMSHDIRTPLNAIMGMTALATAHSDDNEKMADCLKKISFSSKHLLSLVNDILDMSKIERSKITLNRMKIYLPELVEQLTSIMAPQAKAAGLKLKIWTKGIEHQLLYGDSLRINQILINILGNAVKFTPEGGQVDFCVEELAAAADSRSARYRFTIRDTGVGMSEEFLSQIFEPFTRSSNAAHIEGTGLGLSITKGLVDLMDGTIEVESRLCQGTTFRVELEVEFAEDDRGEVPDTVSELTEEEKERLFAGRCFLIAEDNALNYEILCELLSMYGARSVVRTDGAKAVQEFRDTAPGTYDAILMDIRMPEMNGYDAARVIRSMEREDASSIPIIAMTANAFTEDIQEAMNAGMNAHVAKPIDVQVLWPTLKNVLEDSGRER